MTLSLSKIRPLGAISLALVWTGLTFGAALNPVAVEARSQAAARGWQFEPMTGDLVLIRRLLAGDWADDFLVLQPGQESIMTYDEEVIGYRKAESSGEQ